jgi:DNA-binding NarL/FixJ family response regulator
MLRVFLMAGDPLARAGLAALLASETGISVVGQGAPEADLASRVTAAAPDVVVWDLGPGTADGADLLSEAGPEGPPIVALVADRDQAGAAVAGGARGVVFRDAPGARIAAALRAAAEGLFVSEEPVGGRASPAPRPPADFVEPLTRREREVLDLLVQGFSNRLIGDRLGISEHTAKFHVNAILGKLGVATRTEAVAEAARRGLVMF